MAGRLNKDADRLQRRTVDTLVDSSLPKRPRITPLPIILLEETNGIADFHLFHSSVCGFGWEVLQRTDFLTLPRPTPVEVLPRVVIVFGAKPKGKGSVYEKRKYLMMGKNRLKCFSTQAEPAPGISLAHNAVGVLDHSESG